MPSIMSIFRSAYLHLLHDLLVLSMRITYYMTSATFKTILPCRMKNLLDETVLITGAGHGVGRELAIQLASMGCIVVCWDVDIEGNRSTIRTISENGGEVHGFAVDVSKRDQVLDTMQLMRKKKIPDVTILINNAAMLHHSPLLEQDSTIIEKTFGVNVLSNFWTIEAFLPSMIKNERGHIVCISSMCGIYGVSEKVAYCSSKFAIRGMMEALREECRFDPSASKIRFTTIYPFYVDTGLARDPKYRFPYIFGVVSPEYAAGEVIKAVRRNYVEYSIPRCLLTLNAINRIVPGTVMRLILDFLSDLERKQKINPRSDRQNTVH